MDQDRLYQDLVALSLHGVQGLRPYEPGKPIEELEREYGVKDAIKLASNENPLGPSPKAIEAMASLLPHTASYPDGNGFTLKHSLAEIHGVKPTQITLGNGSNDILELLARAFLTPEHEVIYSQHAFAVYALVTQAIGAQHVVTPAREWGHDLDAMLARVSDKTRLVFIANPNNPTGTWLKASAVESFVSALPEHVIVILDEAYHEYVDEDKYQSAMKLVEHYPNLVVTRTFSKAYGLAGLRIGYSVSHAAVSDVLNRVRQPFNVNLLALAAAEAALHDPSHIDNAVATNRQGMKQLTDGFGDRNIDFIPSVGNFIAFEVGDRAAMVNESLMLQGVIVRPIASYEMPRHLRVTIGTQEQNARFLTALDQAIEAS